MRKYNLLSVVRRKKYRNYREFFVIQICRIEISKQKSYIEAKVNRISTRKANASVPEVACTAQMVLCLAAQMKNPKVSTFGFL